MLKVMPIALGLSMILLTSCASAVSPQPRVTVQPTANFYLSAAKEFNAGNNGPMCAEITKDWIAQNP